MHMIKCYNNHTVSQTLIFERISYASEESRILLISITDVS